jgi:hypothetical protein
METVESQACRAGTFRADREERSAEACQKVGMERADDWLEETCRPVSVPLKTAWVRSLPMVAFEFVLMATRATSDLKSPTWKD